MELSQYLTHPELQKYFPTEEVDLATAQIMSMEEIDALMQRVEEARTYGHGLSESDLELLVGTMKVMVKLQQNLDANQLTIQKLRKLLGMVKSSERNPGASKDKKEKEGEAPASDEKEKSSGKTGGGHGRKGAADFPKAGKEMHRIEGVDKGGICPHCVHGKLLKIDPAKFVRISGHEPYQATIHLRERLRCSGCGETLKANLPQEVLDDGGESQQYGYSARAKMAIEKYAAGLPFYRQEQLSKLLGVSISASTIFDQCEKVADAARPIFLLLLTYAGSASKFYVDDTKHKINGAQPKKSNRTGKMKSAVYASGIIAEWEGRELALFNTSVGHTGDFLDQILENRLSSLPPPLVMSDALSSNRVTVTKTIECFCNAHGRRNFYDLLEFERDPVTEILDLYRLIWLNQRESKKAGHTPQQRLDYHREESLPVLNKIRNLGRQLIESGRYEENSNLGKAIAYFEKYFPQLSRFCSVEGAPIDNNRAEALLKSIVLGRKNFYFYQTELGAQVSDILTSIIITCKFNEENAFEYLTAIQRYKSDVFSRPQDWMPWNYRETLDRIILSPSPMTKNSCLQLNL